MRFLASVAKGLAALALVSAALIGAPAAASPSGVVISQVYGGGGNSGATLTNDFIELYNAGPSPVSLAGWSVQYASSTGSTWQVTPLTSISLAPGRYYLVQQAAGTGGTQALPTPDKIGTIPMAGAAGKVALVTNITPLSGSSPTAGTYEDAVGYGAANFFEGAAPAPAPGNTTAVLRAAGGCTDTNNNGTDFAAGPPTPRNTASPLGTCGGGGQPIVASCPSALTVATGTTIDFPLSATDADSIVDSAAFVSGNAAGMTLTGLTPAAANGGTANVKLALAAGVAAGSYPVVVQFGNNAAQTASCTVNVTVGAVSGAFTPIYTIQGSGPTSTLLGTRTTRGVVTKVVNNGYFMQDPTGDGDAATSDGIFVFTSTAPYVSAGQLVQITGTVSEFDVSLATANPVAEANPLTEFSNLTATAFLGTGTIAPLVITLPVATADGLERYEGMLVTVNTMLTASQNFFQGRFGQVTLSAGGRLIKPTNVYRPGTPEALALADLNRRSSLLLDDGTSQQNPNPTPYIGVDNTLRAGDTIASVTGVLDYGLASSFADGVSLYRIQPTTAPVFTRVNARTAAPPAVAGTVKVASFNVLNFFTTFTDGTTAAGGSGQGCTLGGASSAANCRGADNLAEFVRQRDKIVQAMAAVNADVFGLMEIQNNGDTAVQTLVTALNAVPGAGPYAVVPAPPVTGTDAIRVALIYKTTTLALSGPSLSDSSAIHNRPPFAHAFTAGGQKFSVVVNHFKSKGCSDAAGLDLDQGDGQGCYNDRRKLQATALLSFIATVQGSAADNDVIVIGDLNAYGREDPIETLKSGGLVDQVSRFDPGDYSYVFDGESGYIDHALATPSLSAQVAGSTHWHINADEPSIIDYNTEFKQPACATCGPDYYAANAFRSSDHDPVIVGLSLQSPLTAQTITFASPLDRAVDSGSFVVTASASSGLAVSFASGTPAVCSATAPGTVSLLAVGVCTIVASQGGNATYAAAPNVSRSFNVTAALLAQTITFAALPDRALDAGPFVLSASASSGLTVAFTSLTPAVCSVAGGSVSLLAIGTCTVSASQSGNASYAAATPVEQSFSVTAGGTGSGGGDIPTLPEWGLIVLGLTLLTMGLRRRPSA